jgi:hypothetical protein
MHPASAQRQEQCYTMDYNVSDSTYISAMRLGHPPRLQRCQFADFFTRFYSIAIFWPLYYAFRPFLLKISSIGKLTASILSATNENTLALANLNFDFSLV